MTDHGTEVALHRDKARSHRTSQYTLWVAPNGTMIRLTDNHSGHAETFAVSGGRIRFEPFEDIPGPGLVWCEYVNAPAHGYGLHKQQPNCRHPRPGKS